MMNPLPGDRFARRLRQERERLNISQAELARRIAEILGTNVDPSAVTRIEQQTRAVRLDEAVAAAEALDVPLMLLISEDPTIENEARLRQYLAELTLAQRSWEKDRIEVQRLTRAIQVLTGGADPQTVLDPRFRDAIDARVQAMDDRAQDPSTDPDA